VVFDFAKPRRRPSEIIGVPFTRFSEGLLMASQRTHRSHSATLHKPRGYFHDRVERAGPSHFGLACFDCHEGG
jgi:hypothetical protein